VIPPALLAALVDDAGLFPPEQLPMDAALSRHRADEEAGHLMLTHRFLCPASRLAEMRSLLVDVDRIRLGLLLDTGLSGLERELRDLDPRLTLEAVEVPLPNGEVVEALEALAGVPVPAYLEGPSDLGWLKSLGHWPGPTERRAKIRCGGAGPEHFPSPGELAAFMHACWTAGSFKASAGLHRAVREERAGFVYHGYLNLLLAAARVAEGAPVERIAEVLAATRADELIAEAAALSPEEVEETRAFFVAYGSCSTSEPIEDASRLLGMEGA
jgi:hypothetical protein